MKERRKKRLDKAASVGTTEFIGFSAFATAGTAGTPQANNDNVGGGQELHPTTVGDDESAKPAVPTTIKWSPIYTGKDENAQAIFPRIGQKRDATTKAKALQELQTYLDVPPASKRERRLQIEAVQYWAWLYHSKIFYDDSSAVRAEALQTWVVAAKRLPKAVATLLTTGNSDDQQQLEILGMLYTAKVDRAAEVRAVAEAATLTAAGGAETLSIFQQDGWPWLKGLLLYTHRILSYRRASVMHDALFATRTSSSSDNKGSKKNKQKSDENGQNSSDKNEMQRDAMEERFERLVGAALDALELWIRTSAALTKTSRKQHETPSNMGEEQEDKSATVTRTRTEASASFQETFQNAVSASGDVSLWWKALRSSKTSLRRKSYSLLTTVTSNYSEVIIPSTDMLSQALVMNLSSEREASNIPTLLEAVLAFLVHTRTIKESPGSSFEHNLAKPLSKLLRKACYAAKVFAWGPTLLPLTAQFSFPLPLFEAIWEGRTMTLGSSDEWMLLTSFTECLAYSLLREQTSEHSIGADWSESTVRDTCQLWIQVLHEALQVSPSTLTGPAATAHSRLLQELAKNLDHFEEVAQERPNCAFYRVREWFWQRRDEGGVDFTKKENALAVVKLIQAFRKRAKKTSGPRQLTQILRDLFQEHLANYQTSAGDVPPQDVYLLMREILDFCGPRSVMEVEDSLEKFVMNDLLRWIVIHTSRLSTQQQSKTLLNNDFALLSQTLSSMEDKRPALWESLLREIIAASCDLGWLAAGLEVLQVDTASSDWLVCATLDQLATDIGEETSYESNSQNTKVQNTKVGDQEYGKRLQFFRVCLGLCSESASVLVGRHVLTGWIDSACPLDVQQDSPESTALSDPLLEVLLQVVKARCSLLLEEEVDRILLQAGRMGGRLCTSYVTKIVNENLFLCKRYVQQRSTQLREQLGNLCGGSCQDNLGHLVIAWSDRAWHTIQVCRNCCSDNPNEDIKLPSLALIGLADTQMWWKYSEAMFLCTMSLLRNFESCSDRLCLMPENALDLIATILLTTSSASTDAVVAARAKGRQDHSAQFLTALGGNAIDGNLVEGLTHNIIIRISKALRNHEDERLVRSGVSVLSQLLEILFLRVFPAGEAVLDISDIAEGETLWYITDPANPDEREQVQVAKIHYDAESDSYYFSIRLDCNGEIHERQTVLERLRKDQFTDSGMEGISEDAISGTEQSRRNAFRDLIVQELIKPHLLNSSWTSSLPELITVVTNQLGVGKERGIGSAFYDIFQLVKSVEQRLCSELSAKNSKAATESLWTISLALGFGLNTPSSSCGFDLDPTPSFEDILDYYESAVIGSSPQFDCAVLVWLISSIRAPKTNTSHIVDKAVSLLFKISTYLLSSDHTGGFTASAMIATRAISEGLRVMHDRSSPLLHLDDSDATDLYAQESNALCQMINSFAVTWEDYPSIDGGGVHVLGTFTHQPDWLRYSSFTQIIDMGRTIANVNKALITAASSTNNAELLSEALFSRSKRQNALRLLDAVAGHGVCLYENRSEADVGDITSIRLKTWVEGLDSEEIEELAEDIHIVSQWLPKRMVEEVENWGDEGFQELDDDSRTVGRFLAWLCVLRFIDTAAPIDFLNRAAFVSYLGKCGAVNTILNFAVLYEETINGQNNNKTVPTLLDEDCLFNTNAAFEVSNLASLVLFRTIQVLPSLSRIWWEGECPKVYTNAVRAFVEKHVAPLILTKSIEELRAADTFGEMDVAASLARREVVATYMQDDFTLTALISLPAAAPFRNAEVDCSKTLGVPKRRWKRWNLQISNMLNSQGGSLSDALMLWKTNVDKEFEGVEPCPVCYSVLHVKTHKLPALECNTCHNRFHVDCLTQWFKSSGKSQCVLCQQPWQGSRVQ